VTFPARPSSAVPIVSELAQLSRSRAAFVRSSGSSVLSVSLLGLWARRHRSPAALGGFGPQCLKHHLLFVMSLRARDGPARPPALHRCQVSRSKGVSLRIRRGWWGRCGGTHYPDAAVKFGSANKFWPFSAAKWHFEEAAVLEESVALRGALTAR